MIGDKLVEWRTELSESGVLGRRSAARPPAGPPELWQGRQSKKCACVLKEMWGEIKPSPLERRYTLRLPYRGRSVQMSSPLVGTSP